MLFNQKKKIQYTEKVESSEMLDKMVSRPFL